MSTSDKQPEIEVLSKSLNVLEFLAEQNFKPKKVNEIMKHTKFKRNSVDRILKALRVREYVTQNTRGEWLVGSRLLRFAENYSEFCLTVISKK